MEYPFDDIGVDDIKLENFQLHRKPYYSKS
jgi:hypothetical protein